MVIKRTTLPFFDPLREVGRLLPSGTGGFDILVYTTEEFQAMQREGNAFAEMLAVEAHLVYERQAET
ncbi:hypothetical protein MYX65_01705 [Acidobacteria bacterium AH-259-L09]|nr:hypothetical protein [Acidobacteria bacterium AH-259-L09]